MESQEFLVADMVRRLGEVVGRKKLQKIVFLLKSVGAPFVERFTYHFYGPYSEQLADEIRWLVGTGHLTEVTQETANRHVECIYRPGEEPIPARLPEFCMPLAHRLNGYDARLLELMATIQYLGMQGMDLAQAGMRARDLKPTQEYTDQETETALNILTGLRHASDGAA